MRRFTILALAVAIGLAVAVSPFASSRPDGLERIAADKGFETRADAPRAAPIPDYAFPGVANPRLATGLAGFTGTLLIFALGFGAVALARTR